MSLFTDNPDAMRPWPRYHRRSWRRWRITHWLIDKAYALGLISGAGFVSQPHDRGPQAAHGIYWRGSRPYVLFWPREKWVCLLRYRHRPYWPDGRPIFGGRCGKCLPWPCCGSIDLHHVEGCPEAAEWQAEAWADTDDATIDSVVPGAP